MPRSNLSSLSSASSLSANDRKAIQKIASKQANSVLSSRAEKKWYVLDISSGATIASPSFTDLTALIVQGDQYNQRNGDQIRLRKFVMKFQSAINPSASWTGCRVLVVRSKGGALTVGSILVTHISGIPMYGAVNTAQCTVLYDRSYALTTYSNTVQIVATDIALGRQLVQWPAGTTTSKNPVYLLIMSDAAALAPSNQGYFVVKYLDV